MRIQSTTSYGPILELVKYQTGNKAQGNPLEKKVQDNWKEKTHSLKKGEKIDDQWKKTNGRYEIIYMLLL